MDVGRPNKNGRLYSVETAITLCDGREVAGTIGMPEAMPLTVDIEKISHVSVNRRIDGDQLLSDIKIAKTPQGEQLLDLLCKGEVYFRTAGTGTMRANGDVVEVTDFKLMSINVVSDGA
jgi:hypothetical protein